MRLGRLALAISLIVPTGCGFRSAPRDPLDAVADDYVRLVLAAGRHDANYVDAYYGPADWRSQAERGEPKPLPELLSEAGALLARARTAPPSDRREFLLKQLTAVEAFLRIRGGERLALDEEARLLYDIDVPRADPEEIAAARRALETLLPGDGPLNPRIDAFRRRFEIPADRLEAVVSACLEESRRRTLLLCELPAGEAFRVSFVKDKPWGAYNWYRGGLESLIEVNTDLPMQLGQVFATIAHEGYPGRHTLNALIEDRLVRGRGWREFTVYPLYSPASVVAEGTGDLGAEILLTDAERLALLRDRLAPLAGLLGLDFASYEKVAEASRVLGKARAEATRMLLAEGRGDEEVVTFLVESALMTEARARKAIEFMKTYRAYEFTYLVGEDLVRAYVGAGPDRAARYFDLLSRPVTPSSLRASIELRKRDAS